MADYIKVVAGRFVQSQAVDTTAGAGDADKLVCTNEDGLVDDALINAATTGNNVVVKTNGSGVIADATLGAALTGNSVVLKTDSNGKIDSAVLPTGFGDDAEMIVSGENLSAGNYVHIQDDGEGGFEVVKADAAIGKEAHGFVLSSVTAPAEAKVYFEGTNTGVTSQLPGKVYLSAVTPGLGSDAIPTGPGQIIQVVGLAASATKVNFDAGPAIEIE